MRKSCRLILLSSFLFCSWNLAAQNQQTFDITLANGRIEEVVDLIESKGDYRFYYNPAELDSLRFNINARQMPLPAILTQVLAGSEFRFSIDKTNRIFITRQFQLQTSLPANFFDRSVQPSESQPLVQSGLGRLAQERQKTTAGSEENKLVEIGARSTDATGDAVVSGFIRDMASGDGIPNATVRIGAKTVTSNQVGYYTITVPKGRQILKVTSVGMKDVNRQLGLYNNGELNIEMTDFIVTLKNVTVESAQRSSNVKGLVMGVEKMNIKTIKQVPVLFGEADVLRAVLALPGVTSVGEASTGFNVRGGSADQNLILFNDATIYNPSHFFGFFSAFNPDMVKGIELYKSSIPEKFGGRIASVLDVSVKEGNKKKFSGTGGIGPLTSHLTLEAPLKKDKSSLIIGGRSTYSDWLLKTIPNDEYEGSKASFYDINASYSTQIGNSDFLSITGYVSKDRFRLGADTTYEYGNRNVNIKWKHNFTSNAFGVITVGHDSYRYGISSDKRPLTAYDLQFEINQAYLRADFTKAIGSLHRINFGLNSILYKLMPGTFQPAGRESLAVPKSLQTEKALESAVYIGDEIKVSDKLSINAGLRFSLYSTIGPTQVVRYGDGVPRDPTTIRDTVNYGGGKFVETYGGPEIRFSGRYLLDQTTSVKLSYNSLRQYIHMLSNTTAITPTDIWKLSDSHIKPQQGQQVSLGLYKTLPEKEIEFSLEFYYKKLKNYLDYKSGALLLLNEHIETDVLNSAGKAYGAEFMVKKSAGKLNGWVSYTYSRTLLRTDDELSVQPVNRGEYYPANFDKPHSANLIGNYRISHRLSISLNGVYSTGRPITLPIAIYNYGGADRVFYSDRNKFRIPDYFRTDLSMNIEGNHKRKKLAHSSWTIGVYNLTARKNPYSVYFVSDASGIKGYKLSIFGTAIPFLTYNFKF